MLHHAYDICLDLTSVQGESGTGLIHISIFICVARRLDKENGSDLRARFPKRAGRIDGVNYPSVNREEDTAGG